jgi:hypothetical protein
MCCMSPCTECAAMSPPSTGDAVGIKTEPDDCVTGSMSLDDITGITEMYSGAKLADVGDAADAADANNVKHEGDIMQHHHYT